METSSEGIQAHASSYAIGMSKGQLGWPTVLSPSCFVESSVLCCETSLVQSHKTDLKRENSSPEIIANCAIQHDAMCPCSQVDIEESLFVCLFVRVICTDKGGFGSKCA